jgi:hypothetical protein
MTSPLIGTPASEHRIEYARSSHVGNPSPLRGQWPCSRPPPMHRPEHATHIAMSDGCSVTDENGTRLFAIAPGAQSFRAGPVTSDATRSGQFSYVMGCVIDEATRSLLMVELESLRIVRLRGVDV